MRNNKYATFTLFLSALMMLNCINRPTGGVSTSNILLYSDDTIAEESSNTGVFDKQITVTLRGSEFVDTLTEGEEFDTTDLPDGLTVSVTRDSATKATISITGTATTHNGCGKTKMSFFFKAAAFTDEKLPISFETPIDITYIRPTLTYSASTLTEDSSNTGAFSTAITVTSSNDGNFTGSGVQTEGTDYEVFEVPEGLTSVVTVTDPTHATITFSGTADNNTPFDDIEAGIKFKSTALSSDFCTQLDKQKIDFKMYRSIVMFASADTNGAFGGRSGADQLCLDAVPTGLPEDYNAVVGFVTVSAADEIQDLDLPAGTIIESEDGTQIKNNFATLLSSGTVDVSMDNAGVLGSGVLYWTGSDENGVLDTNRCTNWTATGADGQVGSSDSATADWLINADAFEACTELHPILCVAYVN